MTDQTDTTTIVAPATTSDYFPSPLTEHHPRDHHPTHHGPRRNHHLNRHHHHQISPHGYRQGKCGSHRPCESTPEDTTSHTPHDHNHADRLTDDRDDPRAMTSGGSDYDRYNRWARTQTGHTSCDVSAQGPDRGGIGGRRTRGGSGHGAGRVGECQGQGPHRLRGLSCVHIW